MTSPVRGPHTVPTIDPAEPEADLAGSGRFLRAGREHQRSLGGPDAHDLATLLGDPGAAIELRHAAGLRLALLGDPRIDPFSPDMVELPAAVVPIGISIETAEQVTAMWASLGVELDWIRKEVPRHDVAIESFRMARHPVTNEEFLEYVLATAPTERPSSWGHGTFPIGAANQPVYTVSPEQADAYCAWLSQVTGRAFRLPTEAEWEYAATGGDGRQFPWGDDWDPSRANTAERGPLTTTPVGMYPEGASPFGLLDLAGNVEEYVADDYRPYPGADVVADDLVATYGEAYRIARGGSFARHGDLARCARRHGWYHSAHYAMGFRLAESIG